MPGNRVSYFYDTEVGSYFYGQETPNEAIQDKDGSPTHRQLRSLQKDACLRK